MKKIGIIICGRYQNCGGGKCFRALKERVGGFSQYPGDEKVEIAERRLWHSVQTITDGFAFF